MGLHPYALPCGPLYIDLSDDGPLRPGDRPAIRPALTGKRTTPPISGRLPSHRRARGKSSRDRRHQTTLVTVLAGDLGAATQLLMPGLILYLALRPDSRRYLRGHTLH
ncbi:MAG: hypothetical protein M0026_16650 [Nocardiopsaceae bacterium]|nr:hypothetical protein [Nocardiopsaceae bacterium]